MRATTKMHKRRRRLAEQQWWLCWWCGLRMTDSRDHADRMRVTLEHVIPRSEGGPNHHDNYVVSHAECNNRRQSRCVPPHPLMLMTPRYTFLKKVSEGDIGAAT